MKTFPSAFTTEKNKKTGASPVWILKCPFATGTVYLSDMVFAIASWNGGITTKSWIKAWGTIDEDISGDMSLTKVSDFSVDVLVDQNNTPNMATILASATNNVETTAIELYLWFLGLNPSTDPPQLMWTGNITDYAYLDELTYRLDLVDQGYMADKYVGTVLTESDYPKIDPADVGKIAPIVIGAVKKVPLPCVVAGGACSLTADITATATTIPVDDVSSFPYGTCVVKIGEEILNVTVSTSNMILAGRGQNGTVAVPHSTGDKVVEYISAGYKYIANDGTRAISFGNVYVDGELMPGGEYDASLISGNYCLVFTHGPVDKSASENLSPFSVVSDWVNGANAMDGDESTAATSMIGDSRTLTVSFAVSSKKATVVRQEIEVKLNVPSGATLTFSGWTVDGAASLTNTGGTVKKVFKKTGGARTDTLSLVASSSNYVISIYEVGPKAIFTYRVNQGGDTAAKVIVGSVVTADLSTGDSIRGPDNAIKSLLNIYGGWPEADFITDASTIFTTKGYTFSNLYLSERRKLREWLSLMAFQCRCYFRFARGKAYLIYRPDTLTSQKDVTDSMIRMGDDFKTTLKSKRSTLDEIINKITVTYDRNWATGAVKSLATATDAASIARYGEKERNDLFAFDFVRTKAMAEDLRDFYLGVYKERNRIFTMEVFLDNVELDFGDAVTLIPAAYACEVQKVNITPGSGKDMRNDKIELVLRQRGDKLSLPPELGHTMEV